MSGLAKTILRFPFALIVTVIVLDQLSKLMIVRTPVFNALGCLDRTQACGKIEVSSVFDLTMVWNRGISYGMFQSEGIFRWLLVIVTLCVSAGFFYWLTQETRKWSATGLALVIGGAIGNLIDRVYYGAVVDFLDFSGIYFIWVFNVADAAVCVGAALLFLDQFLMSPKKPPADVGTLE